MLFSFRRFALGLLGLALVSQFSARAADEAAPSSAEILQKLYHFNSTGTVLHIAAHPDDENTQLITYLSRSRGYRTAYLSLTRGDGGQNELGRDFDEKLGVARTQELLAARKLDGGRQFFTRAIDFGFSKSPEETLQFWNKDQVLADVVRVIRKFQPDVIVTRFPVPPGSGGHGHHTASAMLAVEAFKLAADPNAYPDQLRQGLTVWQPKRVVWNGFGGGRNSGDLTGPTVTMDIGGEDPVTKEAYGTLANRSRGMHKTQGFGQFAARTATGPNVQSFMLLGGEAATKDLMDGIDTTWNRLPGGAAIGKAAEEIMTKFKSDNPGGSVAALLSLRKKLAELPTSPLVADKREQLDEIIRNCLGLQLETNVEHAEIVPGENVRFHTAMVMESKVKKISVEYSEVRVLGTRSRPVGLSVTLQTGRVYSGDFEAPLPANTAISQAYWLQKEGAAGISTVDDPTMIGLPENPPVIVVDHVLLIDGQQFIVRNVPKEITQDANGEHQRGVAAIPPASLSFNSEIFVVAPGQTKTVTVKVAGNRNVINGTVRLVAPEGWKVSPASHPVPLVRTEEAENFSFEVTAPATSERPALAGKAATDRLIASVEIDGKTYSFERQKIRYDHIPLQLLQPAARARLAAFDVAIKGKTVGYVPGAGDYVAECLEQMGYTVRRLAGADLTLDNLKKLDAVVIGVRAFNEREDLDETLPNLAAYAAGGGTVIAQYNRPNGLKIPDLGPYPLSIQGPAPQLRVTDEKSPVQFLLPDSPVLTTPNRITPADFEGWVQERGAYFPSEWDKAKYETPLAFNDPGEKPLSSGVLVAKVGKGYYVYTSLAFFRQLPAGVPGAYRLFANLVSLGK